MPTTDQSNIFDVIPEPPNRIWEPGEVEWMRECLTFLRWECTDTLEILACRGLGKTHAWSLPGPGMVGIPIARLDDALYERGSGETVLQWRCMCWTDLDDLLYEHEDEIADLHSWGREAWALTYPEAVKAFQRPLDLRADAKDWKNMTTDSGVAEFARPAWDLANHLIDTALAALARARITS
ncbi:hypothetical protein NQ036_06880 [Brevibacterium sp. 91QC2O2]|uniref:hypothetical protein n=1 Tax=Brevibacterium sp. 91QC2O2 TaxID=2968458 RepID=UPI00211C6A32|nr:hypothetical protein [Brevibacterium sp. 91QC2O2]MCQ9367968.1 hypothetical protein [Brevibacterium sp. 91QC2O2]